MNFAPDKVYLIIGAIAAILFCLVTPPFEVPDEPMHFYRAFQLSEGEIRSPNKDGMPRTMLPSSLASLENHFAARETRSNRPPAHPWRDTLEQLQKPLLPERKTSVAFVNYPPLAYVPEALVIALMRVFEAPPLWDLYVARLVNALIGVGLTAWALRLLPTAREATMVVALLPMYQSLIASASQDAILLPCAFLVTAIGLRAYQNRGWSKAEAVLAGIAGLVLCLAKPVYLPLLAIGLAAAVPQADDTPALRKARKELIVFHGMIILTVAAATFLWVHSSRFLSMTPLPGVDSNPGHQVAFIAAHPFGFVMVILRSYWLNWYFYLRSAIGVLGWLNLSLNKWLYEFSLAALLAAFIAPAGGKVLQTRLAFAWCGLLVIVCMGLVQAAGYVAWEAVGAQVTVFTQGRYFLEVLPLLCAMIASALPANGPGIGRKVAYGAVVATMLAVTLGTLQNVAINYRIFQTSAGSACNACAAHLASVSLTAK